MDQGLGSWERNKSCSTDYLPGRSEYRTQEDAMGGVKKKEVKRYINALIDRDMLRKSRK